MDDERRMISDPGSRAPWTHACAAYVRGRQCPDGGFCSYRDWGVEEPNPRDTYAAVRALGLLGAPIPNRDLVVQWLHALQVPEGGFATPEVAFFAMEALRELEVRPAFDPTEYLSGRLAAIGSWHSDDQLVFSRALRGMTELVAVSLHCAAPPVGPDRDVILANLRSLRAPTGGYGKPAANLIDTRLAVTIFRIFGAHVETAELRAFLRECAHPEIGFTLVPGSTAASLESQWSGVLLSALLREPISHPVSTAIRRFVLSTQNAKGGFARAPDAIATLDDTRLALELFHPPITPASALERPL